jgi:hypothetical protein
VKQRLAERPVAQGANVGPGREDVVRARDHDRPNLV